METCMGRSSAENFLTANCLGLTKWVDVKRAMIWSYYLMNLTLTLQFLAIIHPSWFHYYWQEELNTELLMNLTLTTTYTSTEIT